MALEKMTPKKMRAQYVISFVISVVIFLFLLIYVIQSTLDWISPMFLQAQENERKLVADSLLTLLVTQPGSHEIGTDWENNFGKTTQLGLASDYLILSNQKVSALEKLDSDQIKTLLGPKYNYKICVGDACSLADIRTGPSSIQGEKFSEGTYLNPQGKKITVRVTVQ